MDLFRIKSKIIDHLWTVVRIECIAYFTFDCIDVSFWDVVFMHDRSMALDWLLFVHSGVKFSKSLFDIHWLLFDLWGATILKCLPIGIHFMIIWFQLDINILIIYFNLLLLFRLFLIMVSSSFWSVWLGLRMSWALRPRIFQINDDFLTSLYFFNRFIDTLNHFCFINGFHHFLHFHSLRSLMLIYCWYLKISFLCDGALAIGFRRDDSFTLFVCFFNYWIIVSWRVVFWCGGAQPILSFVQSLLHLFKLLLQRAQFIVFFVPFSAGPRSGNLCGL